MKKIIILYPYKFSTFNFFQYEIDLLKKKKVEIEIHDLSDLFISKKFKKMWKSDSYQNQNIKFKNIFSWFFYIIKIPVYTNILNCTNLNFNSINCLFIKTILSIKGFRVFIYNVDDILDDKPIRNFEYYVFKIFKEHKYDIIFYFNLLKRFIFFNLSKIVRYKKEIILTNKNKKYQNNLKNRTIISIHSFDYSNFLRSVNKIKKNKYFVYLDTGFPYHSGDIFLDKSIDFQHYKFKMQKYINELNSFFNLIEEKFKKKVLIVPHPKFRLLDHKKNYYPFFNNFKNFNKFDTNDAVREAYCVLINTITTSVSYAVLNYKPIIFLESQTIGNPYSINYIRNIKKFLTYLDLKSLSINQGNLINKKDIRINKIAYDKYKFKYLQNLNDNLRSNCNSDIIFDHINQDLIFKK